MRFLFLIISVGFLTACATTAKYEAVLNTWVGSSESDLVSKWGIPSSTYPLGDGKMLMYQHNGGTVSTAQPIGNMYFVNSTSYWCKTTFTIDGLGIIQNWRWEGNACKAK